MDLISASDTVARLYEHCYKLVTNYDDYSFSPTDKEQTMIINFTSWLDKKYKLESVGVPILLKYFLFQFNYWHQKETRFDGLVMLGWVIGPKAIQRWINIEDRGKIDFLVNVYFAKKKDVSYSSILNHLCPPKVSLAMLLLNDVEELEKSRYFNNKEGRGLLHCIEATTLYNGRSIYCLQCNDKSDCRILLKNNFPHIAAQRL